MLSDLMAQVVRRFYGTNRELPALLVSVILTHGSAMLIVLLTAFVVHMRIDPTIPFKTCLAIVGFSTVVTIVLFPLVYSKR